MSKGNLTNESLTLYVILDSIGIGLCAIAICKTFIFILFILIRRHVIQSKEKIVFLLSLNMYTSIFVFALFILDMFISMMKGHINPDVSEMDQDTQWCRIKVYLSTIALISSLYSNTFQALYRFFRIIYYTRPSFYQNIYFYSLGILILVCLSALQPLPILLIGEYQYEDYHCQISLISWRGMTMATFLIWLLPVSLTIVIYVCTVHYIRHNSLTFTVQQQKRIKRDMTVIRRILWLVIFIVLFGMPAVCTTIVYYLFGYVGWWANHLTWSTFILSFTGMSVVQTCYSPHLRVLWSKRRQQIVPTTAITLRTLN
ncbi:unnamed protein product [Adineta steineri]|uniref:G-protein coupled receptors family 1 profile domain-containing protein n=1 Tax=Adineta steineri TaxID=433720 RepID=A0A814RF08_9BILA|nr:unnamed protein product [Adineta steineri]CAF1201784.1 unnamed protein product [Adineta steineri]